MAATIIAIGVAVALARAGSALANWAKHPPATKHQHKWDVYADADLEPRGNEGKGPIIGKMFVLRCSGCGDIQHRVLR